MGTTVPSPFHTLALSPCIWVRFMRRACDSNCRLQLNRMLTRLEIFFCIGSATQGHLTSYLSSDNVLSPRSVRRCNASELWPDELLIATTPGLQ